MLKKRLIFTLLYDSGSFVLSRNFRPQKVGNLDWLIKNYDFSRVAFCIDELIILNISPEGECFDEFCETLCKISQNCFVPISAGGGIRSFEHARQILRSGADKIVLNSLIFDNSKIVREISSEFGQQCLVASIDFRRSEKNSFQIYTSHALRVVKHTFCEVLEMLNSFGIGEVYLNSIDRDGTGQGYDLSVLNAVPDGFMLPVLLAGGVGNSQHLIEGINDYRVSGVATANLFNFVGNGLERARKLILDDGIRLALWPDPSSVDLLKDSHGQ